MCGLICVFSMSIPVHPFNPFRLIVCTPNFNRRITFQQHGYVKEHTADFSGITVDDGKREGE